MQPTAVSRAIEDAGFHPSMLKHPESVFMSKAFWVALGKTRGWGQNIHKGVMHHLVGDKLATDDWEMTVSEYRQHQLIDAINQGQTPEQFFLSLEGNEV